MVTGTETAKERPGQLFRDLAFFRAIRTPIGTEVRKVAPDDHFSHFGATFGDPYSNLSDLLPADLGNGLNEGGRQRAIVCLATTGENVHRR